MDSDTEVSHATITGNFLTGGGAVNGGTVSTEASTEATTDEASTEATTDEASTEATTDEASTPTTDADPGAGVATAEPTDEAAEATTDEATEATTDEATEADPKPTSRNIQRQKGALEQDVKSVCDHFVRGNIDIGDGKLTPHRIGSLIEERDVENYRPSTGAVNAVLKRWEECGIASLTSNPVAFSYYTEEAAEHGMTVMKERHAAARQAAKVAERQQAEASSV